ncbi:hypothetical protein C8J38_11029 [Rhizobium sp. PP-WC-2G-219]|nr:hypothetical protein C8J38_11029 [Rhizobium sp. PP-WC-2G-219]
MTRFAEWTAKVVESRILEMAEALRLAPAAKGPREFGNSMPAPVRAAGESYGYGQAYWRQTASAGSLGRMEVVWKWINSLPDVTDRKLLYAWSFVKVRKGLKISAFAADNDMNGRTLRREITKICQKIADTLNQRQVSRLSSADLHLSEIQAKHSSYSVASEKCATYWRSEDAKPQIDPSAPIKRRLEHR